MDENISKRLKELRALNNVGALDDNEDLGDATGLWKNRLEYSVLVNCFKHHSEEVRLVALALIVESKKSTQCFGRMDLEAITVFLRYNLGERMEYVPLIKKALKRMKESLAVLRRHIAKDEKMRERESLLGPSEEERRLYTALRTETTQQARDSLSLVEIYAQFFEGFRAICINGLRPGSTNARKRSSLSMLRLGQEMLDDEFAGGIAWSVDQADKLFECLLLDTYEANKETIYEIVKGIDPRLLGLNVSARVRDIVDVALDLANCIRPIDSITASYMLKIALLSPVINDALENYSYPFELPKDTVDQPKLKLILIILERLKDPLKLTEENIVAATGKHSLYGYLFCIRNLLGVCDLGKVIEHNHEAWTRTIAETVSMSLRLNRAVSQIVNNSSPEGHLPMDMDARGLRKIENENATSVPVTPQMVLICSWRTVKEVSLLFGYLASRSPIVGENDPRGLLNVRQLVEIGEQLVTLLFETKHRGAFEQAHVGFGQLCQRLWRSSQESLKKMPKIWLHHLLLAISGLSPSNAKLCATRRSAGVPFMVQALVSSDPNVQARPSCAVFHSIMKILLGFTDLAESGSQATTARTLLYEGTIFVDFQEPDNARSDEIAECARSHETVTERKTHSLNILRALFKHAQLGDLSRTYAADGLAAAIRSYDGKTWAERNAATLLFSSLIIRIFGVQRTKDHVNLTVHNKMTGRIFFERYPNLLEFMLNELQAFVESSDSLIKPSVQSILLLLSRLYPSLNSDDADTKWKIDEFVRLVSACAKSRVYKTRELSARALVPLLTERTMRTFILELFEKLSSSCRSLELVHGSSFNARHGYALQILEIITRSPRFAREDLTRERLESFVVETRWIINDLEIDNARSACFPLAAVYVTALRELATLDVTPAHDATRQLFSRLVAHLAKPERLKERPGRDIYELAAAKFFIKTAENDFFRVSSGETREREIIESSSLLTWRSLLSHRNTQARIAAWSRVFRVIENTSDEKLLDLTIVLGLDAIAKTIVDPDLQDAVYDCLSEILSAAENPRNFFDLGNQDPIDVCAYVVEVLVSSTDADHYREGSSFLRLLGKAYGKLPRTYKDEYFTRDYERTIYKIFLDNTWMGSTDTACRLAVSDILHDIFIKKTTDPRFDYWLILDWWTSLLCLLVDDNSEVRKNASQVLNKLVSPTKSLECIFSTMETFFDLFFAYTSEMPNATFAALFTWSTSLSGDADYEMDESDVFNKCYNYEIFEPLQISEQCKRILDISMAYSPEEELPIEVRLWLSERLFIDAKKFSRCRELVHEYGKSLPRLEGKLSDVIDPTYNDKLLRAMAYENFLPLGLGASM